MFNSLKKASFYILLITLMVISVGCQQKDSNETKLKIATGILPIKGFADAIGGKYVDVEALIPAGANPHNYQPSPSLMKFLSDASLYIYIGVPAENENIMPKISDFNREIQILNLQIALAAEHPFLIGDEHDHEAEAEDADEAANTDAHHALEPFMLEPTSEIGAYAEYDPHTWVSPRRAITIVKTITAELTALLPEQKEYFESNALTLTKQLEQLDQSILDEVNALDNKTFIIFHSSYNYFALDYGLEFVSVENEGKSPTIRDIQNAIDTAKTHGSKVIFYQNEFSVEQAKAISEEIQGDAVALEPLSENYFEAMQLLLDHLK